MMRRNMNQPGKSLGVIGQGGLGHLAVKFGKAFGLNVTVVSSDELQMRMLILYHHHPISLHFIIDTASGDIPFDPYRSAAVVVGFTRAALTRYCTK
ncbi:unnamed protein product [Coffea canephora]|uniref:Alcohol dehydrogenase-like C-terminal domain-containing protein n=1 Tax=Coffea canephora TaxID=49390 RepID=A0A068V3U0_COFCA|nr:unnamed protein product [Coffea canephora]